MAENVHKSEDGLVETTHANNQPSSYISALKHFSSQARQCAPQNRMIERLRECTDMELARIGLNRAEIEQSVYGRKS